MKLATAIVLAIALIVPAMAVAADDDVEALRAQLAAQQALLNQALENSKEMRAQMSVQAAQLNDLHAKMAAPRADSHEAPAGVLSLRKNAKVTIGGIVGPRYTYHDATVKTSLVKDALPDGTPVYTRRGDGRRVKTEDIQYGDLRVKDAKFDVKIDVNDHIDAFIRLDLQDTNAPRSHVSGIAQNYWIRWKNICNSGFGILIGRDQLKYGDNQPIGLLGGWNKSMNDTSMTFYTPQSGYVNYDGAKGNGMFAYDSLIPAHTTYDWLRVTQINPHWESHDGKLRVDLSIIQSLDRMTGFTGERPSEYVDAGGTVVRKYRSINYGLGSVAARVMWKPVEGLKLTASAMNLYAQNRNGFIWGPEARRSGGDYGVDANNHNSSVNLAIQYRPAFARKLNLWAQWTHGWNEAWVDDMDSDSMNFGVSYDFTGNFTVFVQGDYLRVKNRQSDLWRKASGWAVYSGLVYKLPYGAQFESGWRHEEIRYQDRDGTKHTKLTGDTIYAQMSLLF